MNSVFMLQKLCAAAGVCLHISSLAYKSGLFG